MIAAAAATIPVEPVEVHERFDPVHLSELRPEWTELYDAAQGPSPFLSWEWLHPWWRLFGGRRQLWILEARGPGRRLDGLLVLCTRGGLGGGRRWGLLGNGVTGADHLDLLVRRGREGEVRAAIAGALARALPRWDRLDLEDLPCGTATLVALRGALAGAGARVDVQRRFSCPGVALAGGTFEEHLGRIKRRETWLRRRRWLERQPGYRIEVVTAPGDARSAMDEFLRLHHARWEEEGGSYGIPRGACEEFHREVAPLLASRGWLRLYLMLVEGRAIASVYGLEVHRRFYYYQSGYDPAWSSRSPGIVLVGKTFEDAYARGLTDYDFLRGEEPYKLDWTWDRRETCALRAAAPGLRAAATGVVDQTLHGARALARSVVPAGTWAALSRVRRALAVNGAPWHRAAARARP